MFFGNQRHRILNLWAKAWLVVFLLAASPPTAGSATIAVSIPLSGDYSELGNSFRQGAELAASQLGDEHQIRFFDDGCDVDFGRMAADDITRVNPAIVTGFLCNEPAMETATRLSDTGTPIVVANARSIRLIKDRERESWNLWRLSPGDDYPVAIAAETISRLWPEVPYAIVDDGTIYGRNFTDQLRIKLDELGLKPQFSDTFRAAQSTQAGLIRRLQRSGITAAFVASATAEDLVVIADNLAEFGVDIDLMTTEALLRLPFLEEADNIPDGVKIVAWPKPYDSKLETLAEERGIKTNLLIYQGYAAIEVAVKAITATAEEAAVNLNNSTFDTVLGPVSFNRDGASSFNPYQSLIWNAGNWTPLTTTPETQ